MKMCATPSSITCWEDINFKTADKYVKKLQIRIAVAYLNKRFDVVSNLQHKLIHSFYAKALAVKSVCSKRGKKTPGIDGDIWNTSELKFDAIKCLNRRGYHPMPLRRKYIHKSNGGIRPLGIPTMKDRAMQTLYAFALIPIAEMMADYGSFGFRVGRNPKQAISYYRDVLYERSHYEWILKIDIKSCFEKISHKWILNHICIDKKILSEFLKCGYIDNDVFYPTTEGVPQGSPISSVICNMTLDGLERILADKFNDEVGMIRYADDIMVVGKSYSALVQLVLPVIKEFLVERNLELSLEKTTIRHIDEGVTFLGYSICRQHERIIVVPSKKSIDCLEEKIRIVLNSENALYPYDLCKDLDSIIRGWFNYYNVSEKQSLYAVKFDVIYQIYSTTGSTEIAVRVNNIFKKIL